MPTEELKMMLDREEAIRNATGLIDAATPLLRELVNHACWALRRCTVASYNLGGENEDLAPFVLYRHLIELIDGVETLFRSALCRGGGARAGCCGVRSLAVPRLHLFQKLTTRGARLYGRARPFTPVWRAHSPPRIPRPIRSFVALRCE